MLLRLLFVVIACGVLAVSRVLIVQGDHQGTPSILSLLPYIGSSPIDSRNAGSKGGGAGLHSSKRTRRGAAAANGIDSRDAEGARGLVAFRKSLRSRLGVYAGRARNLRQRLGDFRIPRLRRNRGDGAASNNQIMGPGQFAERLLRQLVTRAHQLGEASFGTGNEVDQRYLDLIRALEVEGDKALGPDDWR